MAEISEKGICRLSVVCVREEAHENAAVVSQLLFGEHYVVISYDEQRAWVQIEQHYDGMTGWISINQHFEITNSYYNQINASDYKVCLDVAGSILFKKTKITILLGSILPIATNELFKMEEQLAFNGESKSLSQKRDTDYFLSILMKYLNAPYFEGGKSPIGIDISGLIQQCYKISGYKLKRTLHLQVNQGKLIPSEEATQPGDVIFLGKKEPSDALIVIAPNEVLRINGFVQKENISINKRNDIICARRYFRQ